jgi:D-alanine-D-alanine ligase
MGRRRIAVLFGGQSSEHAISCISAASVLRALDRERYDVVPVGIRPDGRWVLAADEPAALEAHGRELPSVADGTEVALMPGGYRVVQAGALPHGLDVVFPVLHGPFGEDGTVQGLLELAGVPYVGSGVFASAAAMDKQHMKTLLTAAGLPIGPYLVLRPGEEPPAAPGLPAPWFVKPARGGSSHGITRVTAAADLPAAVALARAHDPKVLIESAVAGREIEVGVLGTAPPRASRPAEIHLSGHDFYDFDAKYMPDALTSFDVPARLEPAEEAEVGRLAVAAFQALDCAGLARVDFFLGPDGFVLNEVNTMPGFTPQSMYPRMWAASGLAYPDLVERLVELALARGTGLT